MNAGLAKPIPHVLVYSKAVIVSDQIVAAVQT
jgi:hypothetical protein